MYSAGLGIMSLPLDPFAAAAANSGKQQREKAMRSTSHIAGLALAACLISSGAQAGCLKGAVVGGVAGHLAHHHAVIGAIAGCAIGHHMAAERKKHEREQVRLQQQNQNGH